jgi:DNA-directed RNA polymerase alpha subunit
MNKYSDDTPINTLPIPVRMINCFACCDIFTLGPARKMADKTLLEMPNIGKVTVKAFRDVVGYQPIPKVSDQTIEQVVDAVIDRLRALMLEELRDRIL